MRSGKASETEAETTSKKESILYRQVDVFQPQKDAQDRHPRGFRVRRGGERTHGIVVANKIEGGGFSCFLISTPFFVVFPPTDR